MPCLGLGFTTNRELAGSNLTLVEASSTGKLNQENKCIYNLGCPGLVSGEGRAACPAQAPQETELTECPGADGKARE